MDVVTVLPELDAYLAGVNVTRVAESVATELNPDPSMGA